MDTDDVEDEFAPDKNAPQTTAAEDSELLKQCAEVIDGEPASANKPTVQVYADAVKEVSLSI